MQTCEKPFQVSQKQSVTTVTHLIKTDEDKQNFDLYSSATWAV